VPTLVTNATLAAVIARLGAFPELADSNYYLVRQAFLEGDFSGSFGDVQKLFQVGEWTADSFDCDKFAGLAGSVAQLLHARAVRKFSMEPGGLAFGQWHYTRDAGGGHAINWFAHGCPVDEVHPDGIAIGFYEPQTRIVVALSPAEINSCSKCSA
jgi:hypothetical protein